MLECFVEIEDSFSSLVQDRSDAPLLAQTADDSLLVCLYIAQSTVACYPVIQ